VEAVFVYLESLSSSAWMRSGVWPFPIINLIHVLGIALLFGGIAVLDLRLLGAAAKATRRRPRQPRPAHCCHRPLLRNRSGAADVRRERARVCREPYLPWKLGLILLAGINITLLHATARRSHRF
jgi:hypothetical protein